MPVYIDSTENVALEGIKMIVYSPAGFGKTVLCSTAPTPLIISAEKGLLSLKDTPVDFIEINDMGDFGEAYEYFSDPEQCEYETICIDGISDISEVMLAELKPQFTDKRQAYGELGDRIVGLLKELRKLSHVNIVITAKARQIINDVGVSSYVPSAPGQVIPDAIPYIFDLMLPLKIGKDDEGNAFRFLQTQPDLHWAAKDRSGSLDTYEAPDLTALFAKIRGESADG